MSRVLACLLMGFSMLAHAGTDLSINVDTSSSSFVVTLPANPTTGFAWSVVQFDKSLFTLSTSEFKRPHTKLVGAGGQMVFTFSLQKGKAYPKNSKMVFKYARSWEPDSGTVQCVKIHFVGI